MAMKKKGYAKGGVTKKMAGGAMKKKKPVAMKSAADGVGKMKKGGVTKKRMGGAMMKKKKGYAKGGKTKK
jgi:hypothetical protein